MSENSRGAGRRRLFSAARRIGLALAALVFTGTTVVWPMAGALVRASITDHPNLRRSRLIPAQSKQETPEFRVRDISGPPGQPLPVKIDVSGASQQDSGQLFIFSGIPEGVKLSPGGNFGGFWAVNANVIQDLTLTAPDNFTGSFTVRITRSRARPGAPRFTTMNVSIGAMQSVEPTAATPAPERELRPIPPASPPANEKMLMSRANAMFQQGDVSGARVIYEYLATQGSSSAAIAMGATFDPVTLSKLVVKGLAPDAAKARQWYEKAEELGSQEARGRINAMVAR